jgi:glycosyltransferase involved in cell wall biosynthesis
VIYVNGFSFRVAAMTIRYLHVIHSLDPRNGGPAEGVKQLSLAARKLKHDVEIVTFEKPEAEVVQQFECPIHYLGPSYLKYGYSPRFDQWLRSNAPRFEAVVVNGIWQYHSYRTWRVLRNSSIPYYVFTHGMLDPWFKRRYPLKHLKKLLYWPWAEYRVLRDARAVLFTSEEECAQAKRSFSLYRANEIVVNYGVLPAPGDRDAQRDAFLKQFPQLRAKRVLLFLGRIHPKKGCDLLLEAFAQICGADPNLHLVIAGPDQTGLVCRLQLRATRLGISGAVTWTGMLTGNVKLGALGCAEAFVLPSHQENFGLAVAEALACGVPVLISDKVNIWREVAADHAGLVADDTVEGTTRLLQDWLNLSPAGRERIASNAYRCFKTRFSSESAARSLLSTIEHGGEQQVA